MHKSCVVLPLQDITIPFIAKSLLGLILCLDVPIQPDRVSVRRQADKERSTDILLSIRLCKRPKLLGLTASLIGGWRVNTLRQRGIVLDSFLLLLSNHLIKKQFCKLLKILDCWLPLKSTMVLAD